MATTAAPPRSIPVASDHEIATAAGSSRPRCGTLFELSCAEFSRAIVGWVIVFSCLRNGRCFITSDLC